MDCSKGDELENFDGFLKYQGIDPTGLNVEDLEEWSFIFKESIERRRLTPKVGLMKLRQEAGTERYAVAIREGNQLWLTLWVRCSGKGEVFILYPRGDREWDAHASYHLDGTLHHKSYGRIVLTQQRQPLTGVFKGTENLGDYAGHGTGNIGAVCNPSSFTGMITLDPGVLTGRTGVVGISLFEQGTAPESVYGNDVIRQAFPRRNQRPSLVITVRKA